MRGIVVSRTGTGNSTNGGWLPDAAGNIAYVTVVPMGMVCSACQTCS